MYPILELAMNIWVEWVTTEGLILSELLIKEKAWITTDIWEKWLEFIDQGFRIQGRQALLLVDNASSYMAPETNNPTKVQDDTIKIDDFAEEIEEIREQPQGRSQGRLQGRD
ncbi:35933_t:CDS:2 [Gigaspora margarita]|uniref:35933_t:CDS:1 n=1 Tax=Gigaspora margarita TaxID=4874 RepID=A0ABN7UZ91_GIGMA|nr:35933_t:CDS:2 [Gigaspora margarita]